MPGATIGKSKMLSGIAWTNGSALTLLSTSHWDASGLVIEYPQPTVDPAGPAILALAGMVAKDQTVPACAPIREQKKAASSGIFRIRFLRIHVLRVIPIIFFSSS